MSVNKKILCLFLTLILVLAMSVSCGFRPYPYIHDKSLITRIDLVRIRYRDLDGMITFSEEYIGEIPDTDSFIEEFDQILKETVFFDPFQMNDGTLALRFLYENGDYELTAPSGQSHRYIEDGHLSVMQTRVHFDDREFLGLLKRYGYDYDSVIG